MKVLSREGLVVSKSRSKRIVRAPDVSGMGEVRPQRPQVVLVGGYAGSGKTELGRVLARMTGWPILDKDTLTRPIVEAALEIRGQSPNDRESEIYRQDIRPREYEALAAAAAENVACGTSVILTAPFIREFGDSAWLERMQATYAALNAVVTVVWVNCDVDTMHTYLRHRGAARDTGKLADWPGYLISIDVDFRPPTQHHVIENCASSAPLQAQAKELLAAIVTGDAP